MARRILCQECVHKFRVDLTGRTMGRGRGSTPQYTPQAPLPTGLGKRRGACFALPSRSLMTSCRGYADVSVLWRVPAEEEAVVVNENWVQCEACKKWRLLPAHVNVSLLPDNWCALRVLFYCTCTCGR